MRNLILICIAIIIGLAVFFGSALRENFTLHERSGKLCPPFLNNEDWHLIPSSVVFVVQGYNYQSMPKIFRDGDVITPLQYSWDYGNMIYYITVHAPEGLRGSNWVLETTDFVEPEVYEGRTNTKVIVSLLRRRNGYNRWEVSAE